MPFYGPDNHKMAITSFILATECERLGRVTLWTLNTVCPKCKTYISSCSCTCSYETISHMNEVKAESPLHHDIVNICLEFQSSIHMNYKVTGLQSLEKIIPYAIFALPYVTEIILIEKLFGVGSSYI